MTGWKEEEEDVEALEVLEACWSIVATDISFVLWRSRLSLSFVILSFALAERVGMSKRGEVFIYVADIQSCTPRINVLSKVLNRFNMRLTCGCGRT